MRFCSAEDGIHSQCDKKATTMLHYPKKYHLVFIISAAILAKHSIANNKEGNGHSHQLACLCLLLYANTLSHQFALQSFLQIHSDEIHAILQRCVICLSLGHDIQISTNQGKTSERVLPSWRCIRFYDEIVGGDVCWWRILRRVIFGRHIASAEERPRNLISRMGFDEVEIPLVDGIERDTGRESESMSSRPASNSLVNDHMRLFGTIQQRPPAQEPASQRRTSSLFSRINCSLRHRGKDLRQRTLLVQRRGRS